MEPSYWKDPQFVIQCQFMTDQSFNNGGVLFDILGEEASIMIHQLIDATVDDLNKIIYIHPALQEITMDAVRTALENFE